MIQPKSKIEFNHLVNYIKKDPLLDWLDIYGKNRNFKKDYSLYFEFIKEESIKFRNKEILNILKKIGKQYSFAKTTLSTRNYFRDYYVNTIFYNTQGLMCKIQLLIKGHLLNKVYNLNLNNSIYYQVHTSFITGKYVKKKILSNDQKHILLKSKLYYNYRIIKSLNINISNKTLIIFKNIKNYDKNWILFDLEKCKNIKKIVKKSLIWRKNFNKAISSDKLSSYLKYKLLPNMKNKNDYPWSSAKKKIALKNKEITLIWNLNDKDRKFLKCKYNISSWDKIKSDMLMSSKQNKADKIYNIIKVNKKSCNYFIRNKNSILPKVKHKSNIEIYVDLETLSNIFFKNNLSQFTFLIGALFINNITNSSRYKYYIVNEITVNEERRIFQEFINDVNTYTKLSNDKIPIFHWGHIEYSTFNNIREKHNISHYLNFIDLNKQFKHAEIYLKGAFNYSLKSIGKAMYSLHFIDTKWEEEIGNGLDAMVEYYYISKMTDNDNKNNKLQKIIEYNYIDVKVLNEILNWIRLVI